MDFFRVSLKKKNSTRCIYPDFVVKPTDDIMVRGRAFYAIWDEQAGMWSTKESDVPRLVDAELFTYKEKFPPEDDICVLSMQSFESNIWSSYKKYLAQMFDNYHPLDSKVTFQNTEVKRTDYVSKRLPYVLAPGDISAYEELISTLYDPGERQKLEWAIGSIIAGESTEIQKFIVLYGEAGSGKSTVLNIIQKLFEGYYATFEAKALGSRNNQFATEAFRNNPLIAIQHDGDLSRIEDNTLLNSIVSHEEILINEKHKSNYPMRLNAMLFMGTNQPVKITDAKSGILRRLIDVTPSGRRIPRTRYFELVKRIDFELGGIAQHCLDVFNDLGAGWYSNYRPLEMMYETNDFANFIEAHEEMFSKQNYITLQQAWDLYKLYCDEALVQYKLPKRKFRSELMSYFETFVKDGSIDGKRVYSYYTGFLREKVDLSGELGRNPSEAYRIALRADVKSLCDAALSGRPAQYANDAEKPACGWDSVHTILRDLDTSRLHYVRPPLEHIVIDFDLRGENGEKSLERNLAEASKWPPTYAEVSKGGNGIHLHYIYDGDPTKLSATYSDGIEVKVFTGKSSLRRKLTLCNDLPIAHISAGLPLKGDKKMLNANSVKSEKGLRELIKKNLRKEIHPGTKPSIDFIREILEEAYTGGLHYDVSDMFPAVMAFANNSTHHSKYCVKLVSKMHFQSEEISEPGETDTDTPIAFYDVEVFPNLFVVCYARDDSDEVVKMINPSSQDMEAVFKYRLIGFNNRRYDNHICYARYMGYDNEKLYQLSHRIIKGSRNAMFGEAYNLSYTDIYDFSTKKQSLKKWEIELGIHHQENAYPWDEPLDESHWEEVADYCANDVRATKALFHHLQGDWKARLILSEISGLTPNDTTQQHTARIIFGKDKNPQEKFVYTDLSEMFPGYKFELGKSTYMGEEVGEGGYVYAEPGMYSNVALLDIASMHPTSLEQLNAFGDEYTKRFSELKRARIAVKHGDREALKGVLDGVLVKYLGDEQDMVDLSYALKISINIVYGLTSAKFDNPFRDPRNVDNIVAKRGALFMVTLKNACFEHGIPVVHIKTDSIKIPNATPGQIQFVMDFGKQYGYDFEHEATYERMCLVNDAVYIARYKDGKHAGEWSATGAQFAHPYVFKRLFSHEDFTFDDYCETRNTNNALYLDFNEGLAEGEHDYRFVGKTGRFVPVKSGVGGGYLYRYKDEKYYSVTGGTDFRWKEAEVVRGLNLVDELDPGWAYQLVDKALEAIKQYGDVERFLDVDTMFSLTGPDLPDVLQCQTRCLDCGGCEFFIGNMCKYSFDVPF